MRKYNVTKCSDLEFLDSSYQDITKSFDYKSDRNYEYVSVSDLLSNILKIKDKKVLKMKIYI